MFLPFALGLSDLKKFLRRVSVHDTTGALPNLVRDDIRSVNMFNTPCELGYAAIMRLDMSTDVNVGVYAHLVANDATHGYMESLPFPHALKGTPLEGDEEGVWFFSLLTQTFIDYEMANAIDGVEQLEGIAERMT